MIYVRRDLTLIPEKLLEAAKKAQEELKLYLKRSAGNI